MGENEVLRVRVANVEMRLVAEEDLPARLWPHLERELVALPARLDREGERPRLARLGDPEEDPAPPRTLDERRLGVGENEPDGSEAGRSLDDDSNRLLEPARPASEQR